MKNTIKQNNMREFLATCSNEKVIETRKCMYKFCYMFGPKTLILWNNGRISTRIGRNNKGLN